MKFTKLRSSGTLADWESSDRYIRPFPKMTDKAVTMVEERGGSGGAVC